MVGTRHVFETYIRSTPDEVWKALTDPAFTRQFFFGLAINAGWEPDTPYSCDNAAPSSRRILVQPRLRLPRPRRGSA